MAAEAAGADGDADRPLLRRALAALQQKADALRDQMLRLFHEATVQEWMEEHVVPVTTPLRRISEDIRACVKEMVP